MKKGSTAILILIFLIGLSLLLYPTVSDYWNSFHQSRAISVYAESVADMDQETYDRIWAEAQAYNMALLSRENEYLLDNDVKEQYAQLLNIHGLGIMGYIEIPKIQVTLPIYHGTDEDILQTSIGHLKWSSLPVGGPSTHCVVSGHRGLPSAKLFTDLDQLIAGDVFYIRVLDEVLSYEVDQILIVEPTDTDSLLIVPGEDYFTLVTCTPYGINTHRLLVRGHRVENDMSAATIRITADAMQIEPIYFAILLGMPLLLFTLTVMLISTSIEGRRKRRPDLLTEIKRQLSEEELSREQRTDDPNKSK